MSVSGIPSAQSHQNRFQQIRTDFQQLGSDLNAGNLTKAQSDYATLSQDLSAPQAQSKNTINQDFSALGQALQSGSLTDAQNSFSTLEQDLQQAGQVHRHHHHHHGASQSFKSTGNPASEPITQAFQALDGSLQSGNINSAQQAYSTLQQYLQQFGLGANAVSNSSAAAQVAGSILNLTV
jgi:hypothetical protein